MTQPPVYSRSFDFARFTPAQVPEFGVRTNAEFDALAGVHTAVRASLARIQRDDGALANEVVSPEALSPTTRALMGAWTPRGA